MLDQLLSPSLPSFLPHESRSPLLHRHCNTDSTAVHSSSYSGFELCVVYFGCLFRWDLFETAGVIDTSTSSYYWSVRSLWGEAFAGQKVEVFCQCLIIATSCSIFKRFFYSNTECATLYTRCVTRTLTNLRFLLTMEPWIIRRGVMCTVHVIWKYGSQTMDSEVVDYGCANWNYLSWIQSFIVSSVCKICGRYWPNSISWA